MIRTFSFSVFAGSFLFLTLVSSAADWRVPEEFTTIQAAINASTDGDKIIVAVGTYYEHVDVSKSITLTSVDPNNTSIVANTIIDAGGTGSSVIFSGQGNAYYSLRGFTITGAVAGGINCLDGDITIRNCIISNNSVPGKGGGIANDSGARVTVIDSTLNGNVAGKYGGGIFSDRGVLTVIGCEFIQNSAGREGGGVATNFEQVTLRNCIFKDNEARYGGAMNNSHHGATVTNCVFAFNSAKFGGAICVKNLYNADKTQRITNCTFYGNIANDNGGAVITRFSGNQVLTNCIFWENIAFAEGPQISGGISGEILVSYCCVQGGKLDIYLSGGTLNWLDGNIEVDPVLADPVSYDFHLQSTTGRLDRITKTWVADDNHSPCIDTGSLISDWTAELLPNGHRINMGAFGGTVYASQSQTTGENAMLTISSTAGGFINSPGEDSFEYSQGDLVLIEATAEVDYYFARWSGTAVDAGKVSDPALASTSVVMDGNYNLQANFQPEVPDVVGLTQANAEAAITSIGSLTVNLSPVYSDTVTAGVVISQDPASGTGVLTGSAVNIVVSLGNIADIDSSGLVDEADIKLLMLKWLVDENSLREDLNGDGIVNIRDFAVLVDNWRWGE